MGGSRKGQKLYVETSRIQAVRAQQLYKAQIPRIMGTDCNLFSIIFTKLTLLQQFQNFHSKLELSLNSKISKILFG